MVSAGVSGTVIVVLPPELPESVFPELLEVLLAAVCAASACRCCSAASSYCFILSAGAAAASASFAFASPSDEA